MFMIKDKQSFRASSERVMLLQTIDSMLFKAGKTILNGCDKHYFKQR